MRLLRQSDGQTVLVEETTPLGRGGEAQVYAVAGAPHLAAKIYGAEKMMAQRVAKLAVMRANPPAVPAGLEGHVPIAWPVDLLYNAHSGAVAGFLMPRVHEAAQVIDYYNPRSRLESCPLFDYRYLLRTARNLAAAVRMAHARGYVIGDLKHSNVLVTQTALVTLVDTDSFQVQDPQTGRIFPCPVRTPDFTPPELQGALDNDRVLQPEHDLFALGVLIFHLLMEGTHPFAGVYQGEGDPPSFEERIAQGHYPYGRHIVPYRPSVRHAPPFSLLPPPIQWLFLRCFEDGYMNPRLRPDAKTWQAALDEVKHALARCAENPQHFYSNHLSSCPWCERRQAQLRGCDPFPSEQAVAAAARPLAAITPTNAPLVTRYEPVGRASQKTGSKKQATVGSLVAFPIIMGVGLLTLFGALSQITPDASSGSDHPAVETPIGEDSSPAQLSTPPVPARPRAANPIVGQGFSAATFPTGISAVAFSPDGNTIASAQQNAVVLWDVQTAQIRSTLHGHGVPVTAIAYSPQGKWLATGSGDQTVKLWECATNNFLKMLNVGGKVLSIDFSPDGTRLVISTDEITTPPGALSRNVRTYQSGKAPTAGENRPTSVQIWDIAQVKLIQTITAPSGGFFASVRYSSDGERIAGVLYKTQHPEQHPEQSIATSSGEVYVWNAQSGDFERAFSDGSSVSTLAFSPSSRNLVIGGREVRFLDPERGSVGVSTIPATSVSAVAYSPDGSLLAYLDTPHKVILLNPMDGAPKLTIDSPDGFLSIAFSPDGKRLITGCANGEICVWDTDSSEQITKLSRDSQ